MIWNNQWIRLFLGVLFFLPWPLLFVLAYKKRKGDRGWMMEASRALLLEFGLLALITVFALGAIWIMNHVFPSLYNLYLVLIMLLTTILIAAGWYLCYPAFFCTETVLKKLSGKFQGIFWIMTLSISCAALFRLIEILSGARGGWFS